ncbi:hypothetical protein F5B20DRAFT_6443 [Whalleya microplaca]|nr:hypothetical protein F5B20DRAFT_6443 [Whalleya microplaca]
MCNTDKYTYILPDGSKEEDIKRHYCAKARGGKPCDGEVEYRHPEKYLGAGQASPRHSQFPPTPPSSHSASDSERSSRRSYVYVNGEKTYEVARKPSRRNKEERDRVVYINESSPSRSPPRHYDLPGSLSSSPSRDEYDTYDRRRRETVVDSDRDRDRPTTTRPRAATIEVKVTNDRSPKSHRRHGSSSKTSSLNSGEEERPRRRRHSTVRFEDEELQRHIQSEIERQNETIANRPARPLPPQKKAGGYRRPSVVVDRLDPLIKGLEQMNFDRNDRYARAEQERWRRGEREPKDWDDDEDAAQERRLRGRLAPKNRAPELRPSVAVPTLPPPPPLSQRHYYDDAVYSYP